MPELVPSLVSTIIPVYNRPKMIHEAVNSVLAQTYRPIEVILVDDGSTDDTPAELDRLAQRHPDEIRVIHKVNGGPGLAREAGRQIARGEFIQYLDSDDWLLPNKFADQVAALRAHPDCGIAYGITRLMDDAGKILREPSKWTGKKIDYLFPGLLVDRWWHTHTPLYRREVSDAAGAWPKQRPEDWDLEARMGAARTKLIHCGSVVSCHRDHPSTNRVTRGSIQAYLCDEAWFLPRLYECALKAGVPADAPEMRHFSRWAFMRARYLGAMGEAEAAWRLMELAEESAQVITPDMKAFRALARLFGWALAGRLGVAWDRMRWGNQAYRGGSAIFETNGKTMESLRRIARTLFGYDSFIYSKASRLANFLGVVAAEGIPTWQLLRRIEIGDVIEHANEEGLIQLRLKALSYPIHLRPRSRDVETILSTVIRAEYGRYAPRSAPAWMIDAGAYIGDTAAYFLSRYPSLRVIALEPCDDNFVLAQKNLALYGGRAILLRKGLWGSAGRLRFGGESTGASVKEKGTEIDVVSIETLMRDYGIPRIDLLKMDIEGGEESVFTANPESWLDSVGLIMVEIHGRRLETLLKEVLDRNGFSMQQYRSVWYCAKLG